MQNVAPRAQAGQVQLLIEGPSRRYRDGDAGPRVEVVAQRQRGRPRRVERAREVRLRPDRATFGRCHQHRGWCAVDGEHQRVCQCQRACRILRLRRRGVQAIREWCGRELHVWSSRYLAHQIAVDEQADRQPGRGAYIEGRCRVVGEVVGVACTTIAGGQQVDRETEEDRRPAIGYSDKPRDDLQRGDGVEHVDDRVTVQVTDDRLGARGHHEPRRYLKGGDGVKDVDDAITIEVAADDGLAQGRGPRVGRH